MDKQPPGKVLNFDPTRFKGKRAGEVDANDLVATLVQVVNDNIQPRIDAAIAPLQAEIEKLRLSLSLVSQKVEQVRLGNAADAALVVTDDQGAAATLASVKIDSEERYPFSAAHLGAALPGSPTANRVAMVIDALGLKGDPKYWCEMKVGSTPFNRYSREALRRVHEAFADPAKHLPADSPAYRTVINFLEGT